MPAPPPKAPVVTNVDRWETELARLFRAVTNLVKVFTARIQKEEDE